MYKLFKTLIILFGMCSLSVAFANEEDDSFEVQDKEYVETSAPNKVEETVESKQYHYDFELYPYVSFKYTANNIKKDTSTVPQIKKRKVGDL